MPSPFPGMDPFIEKHWPDVHLALVAEARRILNREMPTGFVARIDFRPEAADSVITRHIRIADRQSRPITIVEFLVPPDKQTPGIAAFEKMRSNLITRGISFVQVDLLHDENLGVQIWR